MNRRASAHTHHNVSRFVAAALALTAFSERFASAGLVIDLRATAVPGGGTITANKFVTDVIPGATVIMQAWAQVTGSAHNDTPGVAQVIQTVRGSFLSTGA